jgi:hypothetical protein
VIDDARAPAIAAFLLPLFDAAEGTSGGMACLVTGEAPFETRFDLPLEVIVELVAQILLNGGRPEERPDPEDDRVEQARGAHGYALSS